MVGAGEVETSWCMLNIGVAGTKIVVHAHIRTLVARACGIANTGANMPPTLLVGSFSS